MTKDQKENNYAREDYILKRYLTSILSSQRGYNILTNVEMVEELNFLENFSIMFSNNYIEDSALTRQKFDLIILRLNHEFFEAALTLDLPVGNTGVEFTDNIRFTDRFDLFHNSLNKNGKIILLTDKELSTQVPVTVTKWYFDGNYPNEVEFPDFPYNYFWKSNFGFVSTICQFSNNRNQSSFLFEFEKNKVDNANYFNEEYFNIPSIFSLVNKDDFLILKDLFLINNVEKVRVCYCYENGEIIAEDKGFLDFHGSVYTEENTKSLKKHNSLKFGFDELISIGFEKTTIKNYLNYDGPFKTMFPIIDGNFELIGSLNKPTEFFSDIIPFNNYSTHLYLVEYPNLFSSKSIEKNQLSGKIKIFKISKSEQTKNIEQLNQELFLEEILYYSNEPLVEGTTFENISIEFIDINNYYSLNGKFELIYIDLDILKKEERKSFLDKILIDNLNDNNIVHPECRLFFKFSDDQVLEEYSKNFFELMTDLIIVDEKIHLIGLTKEYTKEIKTLNLLEESIPPSLSYKRVKPISKEGVDKDFIINKTLKEIYNELKNIEKINIENSKKDSVSATEFLKKIVTNDGDKTRENILKEGLLNRKHTTKESNRIITELKSEIDSLESNLIGSLRKEKLSDIERINKIYDHIDTLQIDNVLVNDTDLSSYKWYSNFEKLKENTKVFLTEAELISKYIQKDYSSVVVQYFRAIENQLAKQIFFDFKQKYCKEELMSMLENQGEKIKDKRLWDRLTKQLREQLTVFDNPKFTFEMILFQLSFIPRFSFLAKDRKEHDLKMINRIYNQTEILKKLESHIESNFKNLNDEDLFNSFYKLKDSRNGGAHDKVILIEEFEEFKKEFNETFFEFSNKINV